MSRKCVGIAILALSAGGHRPVHSGPQLGSAGPGCRSSLPRGHEPLHASARGKAALRDRAVQQYDRSDRPHRCRNCSQSGLWARLGHPHQLAGAEPADRSGPRPARHGQCQLGEQYNSRPGFRFLRANRGDNTIVRMAQDGTIAATRRVAVPPGQLNNAGLNGIAISPDGDRIYVTFTRPGHSAYQGGVLELPAFP